MTSFNKNSSLFNKFFTISNRRYIGNKQKLTDWIFENILNNCNNCNTFSDIFAGTGIVSSEAIKHFRKININDFLYSNNIIYKAFFMAGEYDMKKLLNLSDNFNNLKYVEKNYFSDNFGNKFFNFETSKKIGHIRNSIEENKPHITKKEYNILLASLIYSIDRVANTVGHYDAYFKKEIIKDDFFYKLVLPFINKNEINIFQEDANILASKIKSDITYIDPPYNSRQYSRFYHLYETLVKWDNPTLYGTALKPKPENMSDYCKVSAKYKFEELINSLNSKYIVVSYNNTYNPKSKTSKNKILLEEIENILNKVGNTKIFEQNHKMFNTGKTEFNNHKEFLFITEVDSYEE